jgi:hypothetical protein
MSKSAYEGSGSGDGIMFEPPPPPGTHGIPVFPDIDFTSMPTENAVQRNNDPNAIFVVTGANRGIGLQLIKSIVERTKV